MNCMMNKYIVAQVMLISLLLAGTSLNAASRAGHSLTRHFSRMAITQAPSQLSAGVRALHTGRFLGARTNALTPIIDQTPEEKIAKLEERLIRVRTQYWDLCNQRDGYVAENNPQAILSMSAESICAASSLHLLKAEIDFLTRVIAILKEKNPLEVFDFSIVRRK
jgi:hypothetical protein